MSEVEFLNALICDKFAQTLFEELHEKGLFPRAVHLTMGRAWEEQWTISSIQFDDNSTIKSIGSKTECYSIETSSESF